RTVARFRKHLLHKIRTNSASLSLLRLTSIDLVMPSNRLILCRPLLLLPPVFPSIRVFSSESALHIRWPNLLPHHSSKASIPGHSALFCGPTLTSVHDYWKNHSFVSTGLCQQACESSSSAFRMIYSSFKLVNEQLQRSLEDYQHRLNMKRSELDSAQAQVKILEEKLGKLHLRMTSQNEEAHVMKKTIGVIDKEKDILQETVDEKTEKIANLHENLASKEKTITQMKITVSEYESSLNHLKETLINRDHEISSLRRQLDAAHKELDEVGRSKEMSFKENRRLQDDLATMARENQQISLELESAVQEKEEMKSRVHNYITEVSRWESLMAAKEKENQDLLDRFQMLHNRAEDWEVKAHQAEGESSSVRLELLSIDTERRHLRERVELLEKEIQEHMNAHHAYESQISSMAKAVSRLEEELRHQEDEKAAVLNDLSSLRELCIKLDSGKDIMTQQLNSKNLEFERVAMELENIKSESELLKKQLSSERHTIKNLESLLATNRDKEFHSHLTSHEKDTEIQLLKEKLTLSESKLNSQGRENTMLRAKMAQLQTDLDVLKRQISTERYERERAIQEMRRHGLRTPPLSSTMRSPLHSPEHIN
ncbi:hypothetical protein FD755_023762, partial [Muntiacus reevesi]